MDVTMDSSDIEIDSIIESLSDHSAAGEPIEHLNEIQFIFQPDSIQNIMQRLNDSQTDFGARTRTMIQMMSPLSLAVVIEQLKRGAAMSVKEVFEMEFGMIQGYVHHTEFFEGVRALLIDKDRQPRWKHQGVD